MKNILTVDLEDWRQSTFDLNAPISDRVVANTRRLLEILGRTRTHATFFCLGLAAEKYPDLIREVQAQGHEIASHGWSHRPVKELGAARFKSELECSVKLLEDLCGAKVIGHRAPDFSIDLSMLWAFEAMHELGLLYDSSIFPIHGRRYGSAESPQGIFRVIPELWEVPLATVTVLGKRLPVLGGGYFRLYPYALSANFVRRLNSENRPAVVYVHPYELDASELKDAGIPLRLRWHQGAFRFRVPGRLSRLTREFSFVPVKECLPDDRG